MKEIRLTQGKVALVDDGDFEWLNQWKWHTLNKAKHSYARRTDGSGNSRQTILMHRLILNPPHGMHTDHRNGDGLDNQRANLRMCTNSQNHMNRQKRVGCSSRFKGVSWNRDCQKWQVSITVNGKRHHLGLFNDECDAASAYNKAALEYFGEFAQLNEEMICRKLIPT